MVLFTRASVHLLSLMIHALLVLVSLLLGDSAGWNLWIEASLVSVFVDCHKLLILGNIDPILLDRRGVFDIIYHLVAGSLEGCD